MTLSVLHVSSAVAPFVRAGALAEACAALPRTLARNGARVTVVMPRYRSVDPSRHSLARRLAPIEVRLGSRALQVTLFEGRLPGGLVTVLFVDHPLFDRDGLPSDGPEDADAGLRAALLCRTALELAHRTDHWPDIVHGHDWQGALAVWYATRGAVAGRRPPATVLTIHNIAAQGLFPRDLVTELELGAESYLPEVGEFFGKLSLLKLGIAAADAVTTVSPRHARELLTHDGGAGFDTFLAARKERLSGILCGIDTESWDPERDPHLPVRYDALDRTGKMACKAALQRELGLPVRASVPLFVQVSRLSEAKGTPLVNETLEELAKLDAQFIFLGKGERRYEDYLGAAARRHPARIAFKPINPADDEALVHRAIAGADLYLMPSATEPCGTHQMLAQRYGAPPIVRSVGGLDDSVIDFDEATRTGTGFKIAEHSSTALLSAVKRAFNVTRHRDALDALVSQAMRVDHSWQHAGRRYAELYDRLAAARRP